MAESGEMSKGSSCLLGTTILCAAPARSEEGQLVELVQQLQGTALRLEDVGDSNFNFDFLVSAGVLTDAYQVVQQSTSWMCKLSPAWLVACMENGKKVDHHAYLLKAFSGITVSVSGGNAAQKKAFSEMVKREGGVYSPELTRMCTHLVIPKASDGEGRTVSAKESHARQWGITIVWDSWLTDNAQAGFYKNNEDQHEVPAKISQSKRSQKSQSTKDTSRTAVASSITGKEAASAGASARAHTANGSLPSVQHQAAAAEKHKTSTSTAELATRPGQKQNAVTAPASDPAKDAGRETDAVSQKMAHNLKLNSAPKSKQSIAADCQGGTSDDEDTLFLSGAMVHLACCNPEEQLEMLRILREGGCTRHSDLRDDVTHVVVGSDITSAEVQALTEHSKKLGHVSSVVSLEWLRSCLQARQLLPVNSKDLINLASLSRMLSARAVPGAKADTSLGQPSQDTNSRSEWQRNRCFDGCFFTLTALQGGQDEGIARKQIRAGGGRFYDRRTLSLVTARDKAFAICPPSLLPKTKSALSKEYPDIAQVYERNFVTVRWLDICLDAEQLIAPVPLELVDCQPIPFPLPFPDMKGVVVTVSNLDESEKLRCKALVKLLGGMYTFKMSKRNTHLVVPFAAGKKYEGTALYDVKPVTRAWLIDVARSGRLLPEADYRPPIAANNDVGDQSQFPFEAPTQHPLLAQGAAKQRAPVQGSQALSRAMPPPHAKPLTKQNPKLPKASQGPSKLDTLFSQLKTPVKASQRAKGTPLKDKVWKTKTVFQGNVPSGGCVDVTLESTQQSHHKAGYTEHQTTLNIRTQQPSGTSAAHIDSPQAVMRAAAQAGVPSPEKGHNQSLEGVGSAEEMNMALDMIGDVLKDLPEPCNHASQHDAFLPAKSGRSELSGRASRGSSPGDSRSRLKRGSRQDGVSQEGIGPRKKAKQTGSGTLQEFEAAQMDCSQRVGYEGMMSSVVGQRPQRGLSRMAKSSSTVSESDNELAKRRLVSAVNRKSDE